MDTIKKVGAVIVKDKKLLVLKKRGLGPLISPGGKPESGESPEQTLRRELRDELGVEVSSFSLMDTFQGPAVHEGMDIEMVTFFAEVAGEPKPQQEIEGMEWIDRNYKEKGIELAGLLEHHIVPELIRKGLL